YDMTVHWRVHTKEKPYKCDYCERRFTRSSSLREHERNIHGLARACRQRHILDAPKEPEFEQIKLETQELAVGDVSKETVRELVKRFKIAASQQSEVS